MRTERQRLCGARFIIWNAVASVLIGLNLHMPEPGWTGWNFLYVGCQLVILGCIYRPLRQFEESVGQVIAGMEEGFRQFLSGE